MLDIKFVRENPELVKENIKKKFQDTKLPLVDEVLGLDAKLRAAKEVRRGAARQPQQAFQKHRRADGAGQKRGGRSRQAAGDGECRPPERAGDTGKRACRAAAQADMMTIPNIIDASVPIGKDDSENVEVTAFRRACRAGF